MRVVFLVVRFLGIILGVFLIGLSLIALYGLFFDISVFNSIDPPGFNSSSFSLKRSMLEYSLGLLFGIALISPFIKLKGSYLILRIIIFTFMIGMIIFWNASPVIKMVESRNLINIMPLTMMLIEDFIMISNIFLFFRTVFINRT
jgi:hypothetical protein